MTCLQVISKSLVIFSRHNADSDVYQKLNSDHLYHFYMDVDLHSPSPQSYFAALST